MALVRQPKTAGFRLKSRYDIFVDQLSKCKYCLIFHTTSWGHKLNCNKLNSNNQMHIQIQVLLYPERATSCQPLA